METGVTHQLHRYQHGTLNRMIRMKEVLFLITEFANIEVNIYESFLEVINHLFYYK